MISTEFKENVESGDLVTVRSALVDYLIIDRSFKSFDEALNYAHSTLDVIQPYDNVPFETELEKWDSGYLNQQKVALMVNFSEERINHIKKVIEKVLPANDVKPSEAPSTRPTANRTGRTVLSGKENHKPNTASSVSYSNERSTTSRTGTRVVSVTPTANMHSEGKSKSETDGIGMAMIVGGVAVTVVGVVTVEPAVIGTGIVIAGAGVGMKAKSRR